MTAKAAREAHIICQTRTYDIPDLGVKMSKGQLVVRTEAEAEASKDLKHGKSIGAVTVRYVQKSQETRPRQEVWTAPPPPPVQIPRAIPAPPPPPPPSPAPVDVEDIVDRVRSGLRADLIQILKTDDQDRSRKGKGK